MLDQRRDAYQLATIPPGVWVALARHISATLCARGVRHNTYDACSQNTKRQGEDSRSSVGSLLPPPDILSSGAKFVTSAGLLLSLEAGELFRTQSFVPWAPCQHAAFVLQDL